MESALKLAQRNMTALRTKIISSIAETSEFISQLSAFDYNIQHTRCAQNPSPSSFLLFFYKQNIDN